MFYIYQVAEQQSTAIKTQVSLKTKIACKETLIRQNQEKYRHNIVKMKDTKMVTTVKLCNKHLSVDTSVHRWS